MLWDLFQKKFIFPKSLKHMRVGAYWGHKVNQKKSLFVLSIL
jgi:hypothetical protein